MSDPLTYRKCLLRLQRGQPGPRAGRSTVAGYIFVVYCPELIFEADSIEKLYLDTLF